jgi:saccharopine dehydrogenase (NAD+, L-lysine-forming)
VSREPLLDVMAIDNLPSLLPAESAEDYAAQLLPVLTQLAQIEQGVWGRAKQIFQSHLKTL